MRKEDTPEARFHTTIASLKVTTLPSNSQLPLGAPSPLFLSQASYSPPTTPTSSSPSLHVSDSQDETAATATPFSNRNLPLQSVVVLYPITSMKCTDRCWQQETPNPNSWSCVSLRLGVGTTATASSTWRPFHSCEYCDNSHGNHQQ
jgi:hypothetical protein